MTTYASVGADTLALGEATLATVTAEVTATDGTGIDTAAVNATVTATATGDALATTTLSSSVYSGGDDGSGALVETSAESFAMGEEAYATSTTTSFAVATEGADVAFGLTSSTASGDTYEDAYASTTESGDITAGGDMDTDTSTFSKALSVGIAVDIP